MEKPQKTQKFKQTPAILDKVFKGELIKSKI